MRARFVSMADVTKPMLKVGSERVVRPKRPWTMRTRRMMEVIVTLSRFSCNSVENEIGGGWDLQEAEEEDEEEGYLLPAGDLEVDEDPDWETED